jgi:uncharacterized protein (TIGR03000 family)
VRRLLPLFLALSAGAAAALLTGPPSGAQDPEEPPPAAPGVPQATVPNPDLHVRLSLQHVSTQVKAADAYYTRYFSYWDVPRDRLAAFVKVVGNWCTQMSRKPDPKLPREVPGSQSRLFWIDLRDYGWTVAGWQAVAERDHFVEEPFTDHAQTEALRRATGVVNSSEKVFAAGAVVNAMFFWRDAIETDRSDTYYDLLFGVERFGKGQTARHEGQDVKPSFKVAYGEDRGRLGDKYEVTVYVPADAEVFFDGSPTKQRGSRREFTGPPLKAKAYHDVKVSSSEGTLTQPVIVGPGVTVDLTLIPGRGSAPPAPAERGGDGFIDRDFPRDEDDWNSFFGVTDVAKYLKRVQIDTRNGAAVEGGEIGKEGSIVARQNRLLLRIGTPFGAAWKTFDVAETSGEKDFIERPAESTALAVVGKLKYDAGELIASLPNGGQAYLLTDGKGRRIEVADNRFAIDRTDSKDVRVRTGGSCLVCHSQKNGIIPPRNVIARNLAQGIDLKFRDTDEQDRVRGFFLGWDRKLKFDQDNYLDLTQRTTGWDGAKLSAEFRAARDWYDAPVDAEQAARHVGVPLTTFKLIASAVGAKPRGEGGGSTTRLKMLIQGDVIPRKTWDKDWYRQVQLMRGALVKGGKGIAPPPPPLRMEAVPARD